MRQYKYAIIVAVFCVFVIVPAETAERGQYGLGFQSSFPAWGLSGMYDLNRDISLQAILGPLGNLNTFAGRGLYRFQHEDDWNLYGYGMLGIWTHSFIGETFSSIGFGFGAGLEYDWRAFSEDLPPLFWNLELGVGFVDLDHYNFSTLMIGVGVHYRF